MSYPMGPDEPKLPVPLTEGDSTADGETVAAEAGAEGKTAEECAEQPMSLEQLEILINEYLINPEPIRNNYIFENLFKLREDLINKPGAFDNLTTPRESTKFLIKFLKAARKPANAEATATAETVTDAEPTSKITIPDITSSVRIKNEILLNLYKVSPIKDHLKLTNNKPSTPRHDLLFNKNLSKPILPKLDQLRLPAEIDTGEKLKKWLATEEGKEWFKRLESYGIVSRTYFEQDSKAYDEKKRVEALLKLLGETPSDPDGSKNK
jgi:hypothetical protein